MAHSSPVSHDAPDDSHLPADSHAHSDAPVDVAVVGAGIVGASIAYHLASRGLAVTIFDAGLPASGATGASFAWIGATEVPDVPSAPLRRIAVDEYRRLESEVPELDVTWSGSLTWPPAATNGWLDAAAIAAVEPGLRTPPLGAVHSPEDGAVDPVAATEALVDAAVARGARVHVGTPVTGLLIEGELVIGVRTPRGDVRAGTVVVAAGVGTAALCAAVGVHVPVHSSPAVLVRARSARRVVHGIVAGPDFEVRQDREGVLLLPLEYTGEQSQHDLARTARRAVDRLRAELDRTRDVRLVSVDIGWRPMPIDGEPIVGAVPGRPGLYVSVMHSGVTLAAAVGRLVADEIAGHPGDGDAGASEGVDSLELRGCRLERFGA
ncbi:glycine/D-amino acid oxidase-like deaminating enzyme [Diaminobutyricimonas aerilata]|uniref:Glycine/D-amino acid oxidase-like deaminating enzyme n=1 Tax=Diaminobutyricimonas aerilata TaxID=1162967 RepID=A0A2M9CMB6_9MICO|nr:FAD-dependent oxidoreductase [Diaminobutyricimonas aerilata]PJJ73014.1 glycine/D-amino acid oxidase-like deaminating enzyme [Diaminobutyricimonas aerilata]